VTPAVGFPAEDEIYFPVILLTHAFASFFHVMTSTVFAGFEVLTFVGMKSSVFWGVTRCSPLKTIDVSGEQVASIFRF
jgi:hypothetical protein